MNRRRFPAPWLALVGAWALALTPVARAAPDHLPSWSDGPARTRIVQFVEAVTDPLSKSYVPPADRVAVFDNDGTLWSEQPLYFQALFALDTARAMAAADPAIAAKAPLEAASKGDLKALAEVVALTHANTTSDEFADRVRHWTRTARHPTLQRPYTELTYLPMRELLDYLAANGFSTWIVSGGGVEFMRVFSQEIYGIPPERVIGSSIKTRYELRDGKPVIVRLPELEFLDDKEGKPIGIHKQIGKRPIAAFGNSDGDFQMLEWTTAGSGARLGMIVHHDDAEREFAYDRGSHIGKLERGLDEAAARGWTVISMKDAWRQVYAPAR
jgi:phosphoglycolate phosphatase-like HAD superfamily hydrolase